MILTPKYWAMWDNQINDIVTLSLSKNLKDCRQKMYDKLGEDFVMSMEENNIFQFTLVEINKICLGGE